MDNTLWKDQIKGYDERRDIVVAGEKEEALRFAAEHFARTAQEAIAKRGAFHVALSGGSTPENIFRRLTKPPLKEMIDWKAVHLYWGDERSVPPEDPASNYRMAMECAFGSLPIPPVQIHRMVAERDIEANALAYDQLLRSVLPDGAFDLVMLGMGEDGHTASLFPETHGLHTVNRLVVANFVPQLHTWRMTLTFQAINQAREIAVYILGERKKEIVRKVLAAPFDSDQFPIQRIGTPSNRALWILDQAAFELES